MFTSILCPVDFSADSRAALRYAHAVAARSGGSVTAFYANDPWLLNAAAAVYGDGAQLGERSARELERFVASALRGRRPGAVDYRVALGQPSRAILSAASATGADLIVMGTHGLGRVGKLFFGSTTTRVLERTRVPVLAVPATHGKRSRMRPPKGWPGRRLIAPLSLDRTSARHAARAAGVARFFGASLTLVHAVARPQIPPFMGADVVRQEDVAVAHAKATLARIAATLRRTRVRSLVAVGDPADVIAALALRMPRSLVVLTLARRGGFLRSRPGTISYRVLQRGAAPVLALPSSSRR